MLSCPHCGTAIRMRELEHRGWLTSHRVCPSCAQTFDVDAKTKSRQALFLVCLVLSLVMTVFVWIDGRRWIPLAVASYLVAAGVMYHGNKRMYLVKHTDDEVGQ